MGESTVTETGQVWLGERTSPDDEQNLIICSTRRPTILAPPWPRSAARSGRQFRETRGRAEGLSADHNP
jgi:hypothetical protein